MAPDEQEVPAGATPIVATTETAPERPPIPQAVPPPASDVPEPAPDAPDVEAPEPSPDDEPPPAAETSAERTLQDIYNDYQANKPITPSEMNQLIAVYNQQRQQEQEQEAQRNAIVNAIPQTVKGTTEDVLNELKAWGLEIPPTTARAIEAVIRQRISEDVEIDDGQGNVKVRPSLRTIGEQAVLQPYINIEARNLLSMLGDTPATRQMLSRLDPVDYVKTAYEAGQRNPTGNMITKTEAKKEAEKTATERLTEYKTKLRELGINLPEDGAGPGPGIGRTTTGLTLSAWRTMPREERSKLPQEVNDRMLREAQAAAAGR